MVPNVHGLLLVVLVVVAAAAAQTEDYCAICSDHTMCIYQGFGKKCSPRIKGGVSEMAQAAILTAHNTYRQRVAQGQETRGAPGPQLPSANMRKMTWSPELAQSAQRWANQCDFKMDTCRSVTSHPHVGQAVYMSSTTGVVSAPNWAGTVDKWTDHVKSFNNSNLSFYVSSNAGLYTQMVWAETHEVGCGYTAYKEAGDTLWTHQFYVCNYGPGGNIQGARVYKNGPGCSKCPKGTSCTDSRFPALCA